MTKSTHPPTRPSKGGLHHEHHGARWHPTACPAHSQQPCPLHDPDRGDPAELERRGLHPSFGYQESCEACRKVRQAGHQPDCQACVETWAATRAHMIAVQAHDEDTELRLAAAQ